MLGLQLIHVSKMGYIGEYRKENSSRIINYNPFLNFNGCSLGMDK